MKKLGELATIYRGRLIRKEELSPGGNIAVLSVAHVTPGWVRLRGEDEQDRIRENDEDMTRYQVLPGDVVITSRGTQLRAGVYREMPWHDTTRKNGPAQHQKQPSAVILSANLTGLRFQDEVLAEYVNIFFNSPQGMHQLTTLSEGASGINLGKKQLESLLIPWHSREVMAAMAARYQNALRAHEEAITQAAREWKTACREINALFDETKGKAFGDVTEEATQLLHVWQRVQTMAPMEKIAPKPKVSTQTKDRLLIELD
ncbi:hypothetical protein [Anoxynatronum buryatiense]|uniref:Uncharacterized protein n=1 Tax=Anoxynatronum buryatiense TaxID=489973 RepID=A0AA45WVI2_9CLOT|nr:hypothetical protein [Anoxynatronum buryatiense]SMP53986.1 hypothetical protein SAMN06296020_10576 [Anoxynatronum buryatiense]